MPLPPALLTAPFTVRQGVSIGLGEERLRGRDLERPFRGVRTSAARPVGSEFPRRCDAAELIMPPEAFFSHVTAARLLSLPLPAHVEVEPIHIAVRSPGRALRGAGVVGHTCVDPAVSIVRSRGRRVADPASIFLQVSATLTVPDATAVGDALILAPLFPEPWDERPWVGIEVLRERVGRFCGRGKRTAAAALELIRQGAESRTETLLRLSIVRAGLPEPDVNVTVTHQGRFVGRGDLVYRRFRLVIEYDGDQHRTDTRQFDKDLGRLDDFAAAGWRVVRVSARSLFGEPERTIERIERALRAAGWQRESSCPEPFSNPGLNNGSRQVDSLGRRVSGAVGRRAMPLQPAGHTRHHQPGGDRGDRERDERDAHGQRPRGQSPSRRSRLSARFSRKKTLPETRNIFHFGGRRRRPSGQLEPGLQSADPVHVAWSRRDRSPAPASRVARASPPTPAGARRCRSGTRRARGRRRGSAAACPAPRKPGNSWPRRGELARSSPRSRPPGRRRRGARW